MAHLYIALTILLTVYGQVVIKWQVGSAGVLPEELIDKLLFLLKLFLNPWVLSSFVCAFLASLSWMAAMTKFPLSYAYPFMSLSFVLVVFLSAVFFREPVTWTRVVSLTAIVAGIVIGSQK